MLIYTALYILVFALYAIYWQRRESEYVREHLVQDFYKIAEAEPKREDVQAGGVVYVLKNMESPAGKAARSEFRNSHVSEMAIAGLLLVLAPVGIILAVINGNI